MYAKLSAMLVKSYKFCSVSLKFLLTMKTLTNFFLALRTANSHHFHFPYSQVCEVIVNSALFSKNKYLH